MKSYISSGENLTLTSTGAILGGAGVLVGSMFGVCVNTVMEAGKQYVLKRTGEYDLRNAQGYTAIAGAKAYWDNAAGKVTNSASGNTFIGYFTQDVASADVYCRVVLCPAGS